MFRVLLVLIFSAMTFSIPAQAQVMGDGMNIRAACTQVGELGRGLDRVGNEMQLYNNSRDIWRSSRGCVERNPRNVNIDSIRFMGWYLTTPQRRGDPQFWVPIYYVDFIPRTESRELLPGIGISEETRMYRPHGTFRADRWRLPKGCQAQWIELPERYKPIRLYGADRQGGIPWCEKPDYVGTGFRESR